jgi:hypothetical protein
VIFVWSGVWLAVDDRGIYFSDLSYLTKIQNGDRSARVLLKPQKVTLTLR